MTMSHAFASSRLFTMLALMAAMKQSRLAKGIFGRNQGNQGNQVMLVVDYCHVLGKLAALSKFNQNCRIDCQMLIFF